MSGEPDKQEHIDGVTRATDHLLNAVIPSAALMLDQLHTARSEPDWSFFRLSHLKRCLHVTISLGVNRRLLLKVHALCVSRISRQLLLLDVVSRTVKKLLRELLRTTLLRSGKNHDVAITKAIISFWNTLLTQNVELEEPCLASWDKVAAKMTAYFGAETSAAF